MVDTEIFEIFKANEQFIDVVFNLLDSEGVEERLNPIIITMKGLNLKYSSTMWVISWWTNRLTNLGRFYLFLTSNRNAISA